ncbi:Serine/threonine-protein kinase [uncultured virus]|nr:Serine/threonine-protein kinase [uncultured virus]
MFSNKKNYNNVNLNIQKENFNISNDKKINNNINLNIQKENFNISNDKKNNSKDSIQSIESHKERKFDTIPFRIDFIKELLNGKKLDTMVNFEVSDTEYFTNPNGFKDLDDDNQSLDTTFVLDKKIHDFYKVINEIGGKLLYIKSGTTGHTFKGIIASDAGININYAVKVVAYPKREKYGDMNDIRRPENAELMMIRLLSYFVIKKQTPHIVLPIGTFNTSIKPFVSLIKNNVVDKNNKKYLEFVERYNKGEYYDQASILISEWANRGDLLDFIRRNYKEFSLVHWKVIFFQVISALAVIHSKFPSFRHNDLKANNILVHKVTQRNTLFSYTVNHNKYIVPSIGYQIKLWDFDFACIPGLVENAKVNAKWTDEINVKPIQNRYYDMHYFFNTLIKKGFFPQFLEEDCIPIEAKEFVTRIVPSKYQDGEYVTKRGRVVHNIEYLIPDDILKTDLFFEEFRKKQLKKKN